MGGAKSPARSAAGDARRGGIPTVWARSQRTLGGCVVAMKPALAWWNSQSGSISSDRDGYFANCQVHAGRPQVGSISAILLHKTIGPAQTIGSTERRAPDRKHVLSKLHEPFDVSLGILEYRRDRPQELEGDSA